MNGEYKWKINQIIDEVYQKGFEDGKKEGLQISEIKRKYCEKCFWWHDNVCTFSPESSESEPMSCEFFNLINNKNNRSYSRETMDKTLNTKDKNKDSLCETCSQDEPCPYRKIDSDRIKICNHYKKVGNILNDLLTDEEIEQLKAPNTDEKVKEQEKDCKDCLWWGANQCHTSICLNKSMWKPRLEETFGSVELSDEEVIKLLNQLANDGEHPRVAKLLNEEKTSLPLDEEISQIIKEAINKYETEHPYTPTKNNFDMSEFMCTDTKCPYYLNPHYSLCKECEEKRKEGIMTPIEIARLVAGEYDEQTKSKDKVTKFIEENIEGFKYLIDYCEGKFEC